MRRYKRTGRHSARPPEWMQSPMRSLRRRPKNSSGSQADNYSGCVRDDGKLKVHWPSKKAALWLVEREITEDPRLEGTLSVYRCMYKECPYKGQRWCVGHGNGRPVNDRGELASEIGSGLPVEDVEKVYDPVSAEDIVFTPLWKS